MLVGISGTLIDTGVLLGLTHLGWQLLPANVASYSGGLINNYYWNSRWTFRSADNRYDIEQFCQYAIISLIGLGLNSLIVISVQSFFNNFGIANKFGLLLAKAAATGVVMAWNYSANTLWTFRTGETIKRKR